MAANRQVAHVWAQQRKESMSGSNFYFDGPTIFSYGGHFPIAKFIERKGKKAVLFTTERRSQSTSKHINYTRQALHGLDLPIFYIKDPTMSVGGPDLRRHFQKLLDWKISEIAEARMSVTRLKHIESANGICRDANAMAEWFGFRWRIVAPEWGEAYINKLREKAKAADAKREVLREADRKEQARQHEIHKQEHAVRVQQWLAGADVQISDGYWEEGTLLRVKDDKVETSRGAEIPLPHAKRLWPAIRKVMESGEPYQHNGHSIHVGEFRIDRIEVDGTLKAGCHTIKYEELERVAVELGLFEAKCGSPSNRAPEMKGNT